MNYYALDEALDYLNGYDINTTIEATIEASEVFGEIAINESGSIKEFIQKAIEAIKKAIVWISTKVEEIVNKAIDKFKHTRGQSLYKSVKERKGDTDKFKELSNKQYQMIVPKNFGFDIDMAGIERMQTAKERVDGLKQYFIDKGLVIVIEDNLESYFGRTIKTSQIVDNYVKCKKRFKEKQIAFETERKNLESLLKKADDTVDKENIRKDLIAVNEDIEVAKTVCTILLECIKYNFNTYNQMIADLKEV